MMMHTCGDDEYSASSDPDIFIVDGNVHCFSYVAYTLEKAHKTGNCEIIRLIENTGASRDFLYLHD